MAGKRVDKARERVLSAIEDALAKIEAGDFSQAGRWLKPWSNPPVNLEGRPYHGLNVSLLNLASAAYEYPVNRWGTLNQINSKGGNVKAGEKSFPIVYYKTSSYEKEEENDKGETVTVKKTRFVLRYYNVFNVAQTTLDVDKLAPPESPALETLTAGKIAKRFQSGPIITYAGDRACYSPSDDAVTCPPASTFTTPAAYAATLFHELTHSTGHETRLHRDMTGLFGSDAYAYEELIAESGAAYLTDCCGIELDTAQVQAYLTSWAQVSKSEARYRLFSALSAGEKAAQYILTDGAKVKEAELQEIGAA